MFTPIPSGELRFAGLFLLPTPEATNLANQTISYNAILNGFKRYWSMSILKVAKLGNPVLRKFAEPVPVEEINGQAIQRLIHDMVETMREYGGVGLAAPQVHQSLRVMVIEELNGPERGGDNEATPLQALINPELSIVSDELYEDWEGCLSIPDLRGKVSRYLEVRVQAFNGLGRPLDFRARHFHARVIQHEHDHLMGKVFLDRMPSLASLTYLQEFSRYWQAKEE
jgi:peptide deformylase